MPKSRVLVIDDEAAIRDSLRMTLEYEGYEFLGAATGRKGWRWPSVKRPTCAARRQDAGMDGIEVLERLRNMNEAVPVIVVSGHGPSDRGRGDLKKGAFDSSRSRSPASGCWSACATRSIHGSCATSATLKKAVEVRHQMIGDSAGLKQVMAASAAPRRPTRRS
jgi:DNA-binding NtrC family response regulator